MKIKKETVERLAEQGIVVKTYACTDEERAKQVEAFVRKDRAAWYKDQPERMDEAVRDAVRDALEPYSMHVWLGAWYNAEYIYIRKGDVFFRRSSPGKCKEITEEWVLKAIAREQKAYDGPYAEFALAVRRLVKEHFGGSGMNIYPTLYGIGVWAMCNWSFKQDAERVRSLLDGMGVAYTNEFSEKNWAYRFKISKEELNRSKLVA